MHDLIEVTIVLRDSQFENGGRGGLRGGVNEAQVSQCLAVEAIESSGGCNQGVSGARSLGRG